MKPAPFDYVRPQTLSEACALLAGDENARLIAGGQTLMPMLAMRLSRPSLLVDISRLAELRGIRREAHDIVIGAATKQVEVEHSALVASDLPLLAAALPWVGHPPTRNRGTIGGSIANADPSAEIPLVAVTLDAEIETFDEARAASMLADDFFLGPMITAAPAGGCVSAVRFPIWDGAHVGIGFQEVSARRSDFAFAAAAAQIALDADGRCVKIALGIGGVGDRPVKLDLSPLIGKTLADAAIDTVLRDAASVLEPTDDLHASAAYRQRVAEHLGARALREAWSDALQGGAAR
jgi:CO/xanthine dehydrogenase FAD-binding subunit